MDATHKCPPQTPPPEVQAAICAMSKLSMDMSTPESVAEYCKKVGVLAQFVKEMRSREGGTTATTDPANITISTTYTAEVTTTTTTNNTNIVFSYPTNDDLKKMAQEMVSDLGKNPIGLPETEMLKLLILHPEYVTNPPAYSPHEGREGLWKRRALRTFNRMFTEKVNNTVFHGRTERFSFRGKPTVEVTTKIASSETTLA